MHARWPPGIWPPRPAATATTATRSCAPDDPTSPVYRQNVPATCGKCHTAEADAFAASVHGKALARGSTGAPVCNSCHGEHAVLRLGETGESTVLASQTCESCHSNPTFARRLRSTGRRRIDLRGQLPWARRARRPGEGGGVYELPRRAPHSRQGRSGLEHRPRELGGDLHRMPSGRHAGFRRELRPRPHRPGAERSGRHLGTTGLFLADRVGHRRHARPQCTGVETRPAARVPTAQGARRAPALHARRNCASMPVAVDLPDPGRHGLRAALPGRAVGQVRWRRSGWTRVRGGSCIASPQCCSSGVALPRRLSLQPPRPRAAVAHGAASRRRPPGHAEHRLLPRHAASAPAGLRTLPLHREGRILGARLGHRR